MTTKYKNAVQGPGTSGGRAGPSTLIGCLVSSTTAVMITLRNMHVASSGADHGTLITHVPLHGNHEIPWAGRAQCYHTKGERERAAGTIPR